MGVATDITLPERYRVLGHIASGGMASVWAAEDLLLERQVAVKVLAAHLAADRGAQERFAREARAAARVSDHPHVVTIYDVGEHDGRAFMVMENMAGGTLADRLRQRAVDREEAVRWLEEAASALDAAHRESIVHRDVKPANLLLDARDRLAVGDFGIARLAADTGMTQTGMVLGTAAYISPEQALGKEATEASDRYSLAVVAYELLTGERPFRSGTAASQARQHADETPPRASEHASHLPGALDDVLVRGMAKAPGERPASARELAEEVRGALDGARLDTTAPTPVARGRGGKRAAAAGGAAAAAGAGGAAGAQEAAASQGPDAARAEEAPASQAPDADHAEEAAASQAPDAADAQEAPASQAPDAGAEEVPAAEAQAPAADAPPARPADAPPVRRREPTAPRQRAAPREQAAPRGPGGTPSTAAPDRAPSRRFPMVIAALVLVGVIAAVAVAALGPGGEEPATDRAQPPAQSGAESSPEQPEEEPEPQEQPPQDSAPEADPPPGSQESSGADADPVALNDQGYELYEQGSYEEAVPLFRRSVAAFEAQDRTGETAYAFALYNLGSSLNRSGSPQEAIPILEDRLKIDNQRKAVRAELADARARAGDG